MAMEPAEENGRTSGYIAKIIRKTITSDDSGSVDTQRKGGAPTKRNAIAFGDVKLSRQYNRAAEKQCQRAISAIVDHKVMVTISVILTLIALCGDDLRLGCTNKPADMWFNGLVILCLTFFIVELILSSIGKEDYFLGFFFILDAISTSSLILDLTWVADELLSDDLSMGDRARSGRTAKLGASVGRMVRVLRLIRIVKLYKAYYDNRSQQKKVHHDENSFVAPGDSVGMDRKQDTTTRRESLVGKKLSALTTRRVIMLVLANLLVLPQLSVESASQLPSSATWAADSVWNSFEGMQAGSSTREVYEQRLLKFLYYHNWFMRDKSCPGESQCPQNYLSHAFWVGLAFKDAIRPTIGPYAANAQIRSSTVTEWEQSIATQELGYSLGSMPPAAQEILSSPWTTLCQESQGYSISGISLLSNQLEGYVDYEVNCPGDLRLQEKRLYFPQSMNSRQFESWYLIFYFDRRPYIKMEAQYSVITTVFVCLLLCFGSLIFSHDAHVLVLHPLENMMHKVNLIRDNPLMAMKIADAELEAEENARDISPDMTRVGRLKAKVKALEKALDHASRCGSKPKESLMETAILEKTITKLGSLLALGFGQAGVNIVSNNMKDTAAGVNAMIPGVRVECIIGLCRIRHFSLATEVLQGKALRFVNQIAEIVHGVVDECHGAANKNNGNTFLLIWRTNQTEGDLLARMADMSVFALSRILAAVHRSPVLARYREHPGLQQRLGSNCRVNVSFGLHSGWAIEGAVGTEFKIDASYLSPNVNIAESVEHATTIYGLSFIVSQAVVQLCTVEMARLCRHIDRVWCKGSKLPLDLFAVDLDYLAISVREVTDRVPWNPRQRFKARQLLEIQKKAKLEKDTDIAKAFHSCSLLSAMRRRYTEDEAFMQYFIMGFRNYSEGEWQVARVLLARTRYMIGLEDGPSRALLAFMETPHNFQAPTGWEGVRDLLEQPMPHATSTLSEGQLVIG
mmetsp:Transcript_36899/g.80940  ORF Transcript_36899/g.80940 Transcript_36899/m.80940 type:complete len:969 (+) Transcript_36899:192-3098(+)|eukprot:CAMPEP_0170580812 /NCGR_PEP_ID=MMETSP0224-20130122/6707_1 /TAXON_ID=285029 /ORGANISM="Togula jolla, Strain CCCM 725" /LENGTH=968 /DNA_ID=CAMNT_0010903909 /DNA_START=107 /DNA_END=3013 /DNA_ORIENTATION=-